MVRHFHVRHFQRPRCRYLIGYIRGDKYWLICSYIWPHSV